MTDNKTLPSYITNNKGIQLNKVQVDPNNPGTFRVSEEDAARLRAAAMANSGSNITPEMQAAMGMVGNSDYDATISKDTHNYICYDEAKRNNEKFKQESEEFTNAIIKDNATKEILDEAEATTNLSKFDFGDINEYLIKLNELSFLEAVSYKKKIDEEIARWKSCKSMLKAINDLKLDDNVNRELMKINALEDYKFTESIDDFETHYDENLNKLEQISKKLINIVNDHKHEMDSTKFLTNEMIHLMQGKIDKLDPDGINYEYNKSRMEIVLNAFKNRLDLHYLENKMLVYLKTSKSNIRRDFRDNANAINNNNRTKAINDLIRFFSEDIVYTLYERLMYTFHDNVNATYLMMGFIAKIMNTEKKSSRNVWAKVFVLNMADIYNGIFDIETVGEGEEFYLDKVEDAFYPDICKFLENEKINILKPCITFGLKTPIKKKIDSEIPETPTENCISKVEAEIVNVSDENKNIVDAEIIES